MGQYFMNTILKQDYKTRKQPIEATLYPFDFDNGMKLMEFSWIGNDLMRNIEYLLATKYYGYPFVCTGDYAEKKKTTYYKKGVLMYDLAGDFTDFKKYQKFIGKLPKLGEIPHYQYAINLDKKEYVKLPMNTNEWQVHPLSLLCADGNEEGGGGTYYCLYPDYDKVGLWKYDRIGVGNEVPDDFKELVVKFKEVENANEEDI